jgi:hypothetical protein
MEMDPIEKQKLDKEKKEFIANLKRKHAKQQISDIMVYLYVMFCRYILLSTISKLLNCLLLRENSLVCFHGV